MSKSTRSSLRGNRSNKRFGEGKVARAICDRSGFEYPMSEMVVEPGTGYLVHTSESDGSYNIVDHPQNYPARKSGDVNGLENPRPETMVVENFVYLSSSPFNILALSNSNNLEWSS